MLARGFFLMPVESSREMLRGGNTSADARISAETRQSTLKPLYSLGHPSLARRGVGSPARELL
jgi:hypothetical protein